MSEPAHDETPPDFWERLGFRQNGAVSPAKPKRGCGFWAMVGLVLVVLMVWWGGKLREQDKAARDAVASGASADSKPAIEVTPDQLVAAFAANEVAAKARFAGQRVRMTGKIDSIALGLGDAPYLVFDAKEMFSRPQAAFEAEDSSALAGLRKGDRATVLCDRIDEVIGTPMLNDCSLVR